MHGVLSSNMLLFNLLFVGPAGILACADYLAAFQALATEFGVSLALGEKEYPATRLTYLGISLNSEIPSGLLVKKLAVKKKKLLARVISKKKVHFKGNPFSSGSSKF